jgi:dihydrofolate synthase/folylpolyglutamate synthase
LQEIKLSYFEISTALAFWYFAQQNVDIAIIETGLGGRLDATNIVHSEISVITSIGLDHQNVLGGTIAEIAREKAGIIKPNKPVVLGNVAEEAATEIKAVAQSQNARTLFVEKYAPEWNHGAVIIHDLPDIGIKTSLREPVNKWNVTCAWLVMQQLRPKFPVEEKVFISAMESFEGIPARFERIHPDFEWYFSGSHNAQALESSMEAIAQKQPLSETVVVFSLLKDKLNESTLAYFKGFKKAYFVEQEGERAAKFSNVQDHLEVELFTEEEKENILKDLKTELVIFMGSFYFYPTIKRWIGNVS